MGTIHSPCQEMEKDMLCTKERIQMENVTSVSMMELTLTTTVVVLITITLGKVTRFITVVLRGVILLEELDTLPTTIITRVTPGPNTKKHFICNCQFYSISDFIY